MGRASARAILTTWRRGPGPLLSRRSRAPSIFGIVKRLISISSRSRPGRLTRGPEGAHAYGDGYSTCDAAESPSGLIRSRSLHCGVPRGLAVREHGRPVSSSEGISGGRLHLVRKATPSSSRPSPTTRSSWHEEAGGREGGPDPKENLVTPDAVAEKIEEVIRETGKPGARHVRPCRLPVREPYDVAGIAKVVHQHDILPSTVLTSASCRST